MTGHENAIALSGRGGHVFAVVDVHYLGSGGARAAAVLAVDAAFSAVLDEWTALVPEVVPYRPGEFYLREMPPLRAVLRNVGGLGLLVVDGYVDLDPSGRPGLGAHADALARTRPHRPVLIDRKLPGNSMVYPFRRRGGSG